MMFQQLAFDHNYLLLFSIVIIRNETLLSLNHMFFGCFYFLQQITHPEMLLKYYIKKRMK